MVALKSELWINRVLTLLMIFAIVWIGVAGFSREDAQIDKKEIDSKASKYYVDEQDADIIKDFDDYQQTHQIQHEGTQSLLLSMDRKIDILLTDK